MPFFPFIFLKDFIGFILILCLYLLQTHFGISSFSHPDNALEVCGLLTPLHIVPEWYFLCQYAMLKAVPNKNAGFIILLTSIFTFFFFGEIRNLTTFTRLMDYNNGFSLSSFFLSLLSFLWIARAQGDRLTAAKVVEIISGQPFLFLSYTINLLTVRSGVESGTTINPGNEIFIPEDHSLVTRRQISSTSTLPSRNM